MSNQDDSTDCVRYTSPASAALKAHCKPACHCADTARVRRYNALYCSTLALFPCGAIRSGPGRIEPFGGYEYCPTTEASRTSLERTDELCAKGCQKCWEISLAKRRPRSTIFVKILLAGSSRCQRFLPGKLWATLRCSSGVRPLRY